MNKIITPNDYNYIEAYLTLRCNLNCNYCINRFDEFSPPEELSTSGWIDGLSRIETRVDLPITIGGGEPTIHPGFYEIVEALYKKNKYMDLLTNGKFDVREFCDRIEPEVFMRRAKYASIRFSIHEKTDPSILEKVWLMQNNGYEVGVWAITPPPLALDWIIKNDEVREKCKWLNIDYREKEYLGRDSFGNMYGTYKYKDACSQTFRKKVMCKTSEMLINPAGYTFRCHSDLYANRGFISHILDEEVKFPGFLPCKNYGHCSPCDIKVKFNRFQKYGHCAVTIKGKEVIINTKRCPNEY